MASEMELGPMEAALLYIMSTMALKDEKRLREGFFVEELSKIIRRSPARTRALLGALKSKGYVSDVQRYDPVLKTVLYVFGEGLEETTKDDIDETLKNIISSPKGGIKKRWFLKKPPEECLKAAQEVLNKYNI